MKGIKEVASLGTSEDFVILSKKFSRPRMDFLAYTEELDRPPDALQRTIDALAGDTPTPFNIRIVGQSFEERPIRLVTAGSGPTQVLLWSQMHGDESTATMAITDVLNYFRVVRGDGAARSILSTLTIHFLPMLNPDGAFRFQRRTAQGIDMNRDALALQTPEGRLLNQLKDTIKPDFGFNLHDQELSTVGTTKELTAIALLAPAFDMEKSDNEVRTRAKHVASVLAAALKSAAQGRIARYDDSFEPRAFGDNMQKWGTSTILVESGHTQGDQEKDSIRKLNFMGILAGLHVIASGQYGTWDLAHYDHLPRNAKQAYDIII
ncbi:MAG: hypothetical protein E6K56_07300, partial [Ignavibacteria bacterium]